MVYNTTFFVDWPQHLGGGTAELEFVGAMVLVPLIDAHR